MKIQLENLQPVSWFAKPMEFNSVAEICDSPYMLTHATPRRPRVSAVVQVIC